MTLDIKTSGKGIIFKVHVQPGASSEQIAGCRADALKVRLTAPPADGKANRACIKLLADRLGTAKSDLEILSGAAGREKRILVRMPENEARGKGGEKIKKLLEELSGKKGA